MSDCIRQHLDSHLDAVRHLQKAGVELIGELATAWIATLRGNGRILFCGNGGSAADSQHLAAELVVRFRRDRRALPAIALTTDTSILTAGANDFGFESVFGRQVEALGQPGDLLVGISTSGNSPNVVAAMASARSTGLRTMAFCGAQGGPVADHSDFIFAAPSDETARIQECHLLVGHILCDLVEKELAE